MVRSSIWWNCAKLVEKLLQKQQERLLNFDVFRHYIRSYCINPYMDGLYTSRSFQGYQEHQNRSSYDKVMALRSWSKNRGLQQRRDVGPTSRRCCMTSRRSGLVLGGLLAHFEAIMEGFKAQTVGIEKEENL